MAGRMSRIGRRLRIGLAAVILALAGLFMLGPRPAVDTTISFDPATIGEDLDAFLAASEAAFPDIRDGLSKQIIWADPERRDKTKIAVVYVHGFSASSGEIRPLPDIVARELGANLFFTRLAGHGRTSDAMAEPTVNHWVNDIAEAIEIGRRLGDRVVLMGTSTGATLITWAATQPALMENVASLVLISPNYGVRASGAQILTLPWGGRIAGMILGERRSFQPRNEAHARLWTTQYPTSALLPMAALVDLAVGAEIHNIQVPALFVFSPHDQVVRPDRTEQIAARWGAAHGTIRVAESGDPMNHVIAGDALSPATTAGLADKIVDYLEEAGAASVSGRASRENR